MKGLDGESSIEQEFRGLEQMTQQVVIQCETNNTDTTLLEATKNNFLEILTSTEQAQLALKDNIRALLQDQESVQSNLNDLRSETLGPQATALLSKIADAEEKKDELDKEIESLTSAIKFKENHETLLEKKSNLSTKKSLADYPNFMTGLGTLAKVSNLKWDYNSPEDNIEGFILRPNKKDIVPFKFNKNSHSQFFITNFLWEQIGADGDFL